MNQSTSTPPCFFFIIYHHGTETQIRKGCLLVCFTNNESIYMHVHSFIHSLLALRISPVFLYFFLIPREEGADFFLDDKEEGLSCSMIEVDSSIDIE